MVQAIKKLQALCKDDANKIIKQAAKEKSIENLNFLIDLAMGTKDTKLVPEEPKTLAQNGKK